MIYKITYTIGVAAGTFIMDQLGASGDIINGAWERVAVDIILASSLLGAVIFIYTKVFKGLIDRKIDERVHLITDKVAIKVAELIAKKEQHESHPEKGHP